MPKYASYVASNLSTQTTTPVTGWYDTDEFNYPNLPPKSDLLLLTQDEWDGRLNGDIWGVTENQTLAVYVEPGPDLATAQSMQVQTLSGACAAQIKSGFTSSALGAAHTYASSAIDQQNIVQSAQSVKGGLLSCENSAGVWARQPHTQAQAQQVLEDFVTARDAARTQFGTLQTQITTATTVEAVQAVVWGS